MQIVRYHKLKRQKLLLKLAEIRKIKQVQTNNLKVKLLRLKNPYQPPKKELLTLGSFNSSFPVPEYLFSPVTKT